MPQIWMTYDELATLTGGTATEARLQAQQLSLDRRKSRDGNTRVKLNLALMARFIASVRDVEIELDNAIEALRETHRKMSGFVPAEQLDFRRGVA